jgi:hypothetical protein
VSRSDLGAHRPTPRCHQITWPYGKRLLDPNARWTCTCGASGNVHDTEPAQKTPTKEKKR